MKLNIRRHTPTVLGILGILLVVIGLALPNITYGQDGTIQTPDERGACPVPMVLPLPYPNDVSGTALTRLITFCIMGSGRVTIPASDVPQPAGYDPTLVSVWATNPSCHYSSSRPSGVASPVAQSSCWTLLNTTYDPVTDTYSFNLVPGGYYLYTFFLGDIGDLQPSTITDTAGAPTESSSLLPLAMVMVGLVSVAAGVNIKDRKA